MIVAKIKRTTILINRVIKGYLLILGTKYSLNKESTDLRSMLCSTTSNFGGLLFVLPLPITYNVLLFYLGPQLQHPVNAHAITFQIIKSETTYRNPLNVNISKLMQI